MSATQTKVLTNTVLKGILSDALVYRGVAVDVDAIKTPGVYRIEPQTTNQPELSGQFGVLMVLRAGDLTVEIAWLWRSGLPLLYRMRSPAYTQAFYQVTTTPIS